MKYIVRILGINPENTLKALNEQCSQVLKHALSRKLKFSNGELLSNEEYLKR